MYANPVDAVYHRYRSPHPQIVGTLLRFRGAAPGLGRLREHFAAHLAEQPVLRHRLEEVGGRICRVPADVRPQDHVRHHAAPPGRTWEEVADALHALPLPPPPAAPWDVWLADGHHADEWLLFFRSHHALTDGTGRAHLINSLFGSAPRPGLAVTRGGLSLRCAVRLLADAVSGLFPGPAAAPAWQWLRGPAVGSSRLACVSLPYERLSQVGRAAGVTTNDVYLAAMAGVLRQLALDRGSAPGELGVLPVSMPMSTRRAGEESLPGNHLAMARVLLPCQLADPWQRLVRVHRVTDRAKRQGRAATSRFLQEHAPHRISEATARTLMDASTAPVCCNYVPYREPKLSFDGSRALDVTSVGALMDGHLLYTALTYHRSVARLAVVHDAALPDAARVGELWNAQVDALCRVTEAGARAHAPSGTSAPAKTRRR
ncbi:wax ester/triacylglycerol synthase domain-containing protein [Streptomyces sp. NPDC018584]|uniref:wax ester/triacylglycerol synthase domain-containing protein n=1 Tax=unclassified Streptomyces TaxID=2593676 RepID=UPI00379A8156